LNQAASSDVIGIGFLSRFLFIGGRLSRADWIHQLSSVGLLTEPERTLYVSERTGFVLGSRKRKCRTLGC
jgi:hypothetical protein